MAIIDAILLFDELDLLEIRLHELDSVVDRFLIIEADHTFSGKPKPLHFRHHQERFAAFRNKITLWEVRDMPKGDDPWIREKHQRNAIAKALDFLRCKDDDRVLVSDVDEIPRADTLREAANLEQPVLFKLRLFYYYVNVRCVKWPWWPDLRMASVRDLRPEPQRIRDKHETDTDFHTLPDAGWHFSYLGGVKRIQRKIAAFSHYREYNKPQFTNAKHLKQCLAETRDLFGRNLAWERVPLDESYPKYLLQNLDRFGYMVAPQSPDHKNDPRI